MNRARGERDPSSRLDALLQFQRLWEDETPSVVLASPLLSYMMSTEVRGVRLGVLTHPVARLQHLNEWYMRTQRLPVIPR